jgi:hypothetical protein
VRGIPRLRPGARHGDGARRAGHDTRTNTARLVVAPTVIVPPSNAPITGIGASLRF